MSRVFCQKMGGQQMDSFLWTSQMDDSYSEPCLLL